MNHESALETAVDQITSLLHAQIGLRPEPTLRGRLRRAVRDEAVSHGNDLNTYLAAVTSQRDVMQQLLNHITVQETGFFRHPEHFEVLAREVLPKLSAPVRIWSAGCANGQEAYSIAMVLEEECIAGSVIATDLSTAALRRTAAGRYSTRELSGLSPSRLARHVTPTGSGGQINPAVRDRVITARHNLVDTIPEQARFCHVVFCRNVLIYFTPDHARVFLDRVAEVLPRQGVLFLGSAEAIWPVSDRFDTVRVEDTFVYRPRRIVTPPLPPARGSAPTAWPDQPTQGRAVPSRRSRAAPATDRRTVAPPPAVSEPQRLAEVGRRSLEGEDYQAAITAFRKWAYLQPEDALAHLHLGLALEAAGEPAAAQRAFGAARRTAALSDPVSLEHAIGGYASGELLRLLEDKGVIR